MTINRIRRGLLQGGAAAAGLSVLGFPSISRGQAETIRLGHLTPRTGFLGPLGEYAVMGVNLAVDENGRCEIFRIHFAYIGRETEISGNGAQFLQIGLEHAWIF